MAAIQHFVVKSNMALVKIELGMMGQLISGAVEEAEKIPSVFLSVASDNEDETTARMTMLMMIFTYIYPTFYMQ